MFLVQQICRAFILRASLSSSNSTATTMKYLKQKEAIALDNELFTDCTFSIDQLMELAGLSCAQAICSVYEKGEVLILVGPGNNGGDGLVCARHLKHFGFSPSIISPKPAKSDLMKRLLLQTEQLKIPQLETFPANASSNFHLIVDALFGFSFRPPVREPFSALLNEVVAAQAHIPVCSIDIPSGWDVEKGPPTSADDDDAVPALMPDTLVSLTAPKECARHFRGRHHFLGGRFVPLTLLQKYGLNDLPQFDGSSQFVKLN